MHWLRKQVYRVKCVGIGRTREVKAIYTGLTHCLTHLCTVPHAYHRDK